MLDLLIACSRPLRALSVTDEERAELLRALRRPKSAQQLVERANIALQCSKAAFKRRRRHQEFLRFLRGIDTEIPLTWVSISYSTAMRRISSRRSSVGLPVIRALFALYAHERELAQPS